MTKISLKKEEYAQCNFDGKELHPDDKKALAEWIEYRKKRKKK